MIENKRKNLSEAQTYIKGRWDKERVFYNPERVSPALREIGEKIAKLTGTWNPVEIYTPNPDNLKAEKAKFLSNFDEGKEYQPEFDYDLAQSMDVSEKTEQLRALLRAVLRHKPKKDEITGLTQKNDMDQLVRIALAYKIHDDIATCMLVEGMQQKDEKKIKKALQRKYPPAQQKHLDAAQQYYDFMTSGAVSEPLPAKLTPEQQAKLREVTFDADQIKAAMEWLLAQYNILRTDDQPSGFKVVMNERVTTFDVRDKSVEPMTIYIPQDLKVTGEKLLKLMTHEIEGHARQSVNGIELLGVAGGELKPDNESLYEGLAMRLEGKLKRELFGINEEENPPWGTPYDIFAMHQADEGASFAEIFKTQVELRMRALLKKPEGELDPNSDEYKAKIEEAKSGSWGITYRVMRGHVDMSNPEKFGMSKDLAYMDGYMTDQELSKAGYAGVNEMGIIPNGGLQLMAKLGVNNQDIPHKFQGLTEKYCMEVLLPMIEGKAA